METRRNLLVRISENRIQRHFRLTRPIRRPVMTSFFVNPYSQVLDLSDKSHLKLYTDECKGLNKELKSDGKGGNYNDFIKLISQKISNRKVKESFNVTTEWEISETAPELLLATKDIFSTLTVTVDEVKAHYNMICSEEDFAHVGSSKLSKKLIQSRSILQNLMSFTIN